ncbi:hypothetical protein CE91St38_18410 [Desulfovibrionaceae bacterium]|jgi:hypothetical protein|nr:hypothetical protein CE91St38_18410 [Desulfovibrionaceae bacterium]GKI12383.1 hypothetical protein CE91St39_18370 [Desulfovibrionaceae bacterium]
MSKKQLHRNQSVKSNTSILADLFFIMWCVGIVMNIPVLFYISYIKRSGIFFLGGIAFLAISPLLFIVAYDLYRSIKEHGNCFDKLDYIMLFIGGCSLTCAAIGIVVECI